MSKYHAIKTSVDGHRFDSRKEAARYSMLKLLQHSGAIRNLEIQPKYRLDVNGAHVCNYIADYRYTDTTTGLVVVEDCKGVRTPVYRVKIKLLRALYGITVLET